jgi:hypothetical protein
MPTNTLQAWGVVETSFPPGFPVIEHAMLQAPVLSIDSFGQPTDFSQSATLRGARQLDLTGQDAVDPILGTAHLGILNSPQTRAATLEFLIAP